MCGMHDQCTETKTRFELLQMAALGFYESDVIQVPAPPAPASCACALPQSPSPP